MSLLRHQIETSPCPYRTPIPRLITQNTMTIVYKDGPKDAKARPPDAAPPGVIAVPPPAPAEMDEPPPYTPFDLKATGPATDEGSSQARTPPVPGNNEQQVPTSGPVSSMASLDLEGPMKIEGNIKSLGHIQLTGDFAVTDSVNAYGYLDVNGSLHVG